MGCRKSFLIAFWVSPRWISFHIYFWEFSNMHRDEEKQNKPHVLSCPPLLDGPLTWVWLARGPSCLPFPTCFSIGFIKRDFLSFNSEGIHTHRKKCQNAKNKVAHLHLFRDNHLNSPSRPFFMYTYIHMLLSEVFLYMLCWHFPPLLSEMWHLRHNIKPFALATLPPLPSFPSLCPLHVLSRTLHWGPE